MGTHLNCIDDAIQMVTHNICLYKKIHKKYTGPGFNRKPTELLDCALVGVCAIIRSIYGRWYPDKCFFSISIKTLWILILL